MAAADLVEYVAKSLVDDPDAVKVEVVRDQGGTVIELHVADARSARDSRAIETIGHYNPRTEPVELNIDAEKASKWLAQGAQPSDTVVRLFRSAGILPAEKK